MEVDSDDMIIASRGSAPSPKLSPLSCVLFWSPPSPNTEKASDAPSAPSNSCTPGIAEAIAARSPICSAFRNPGSVLSSDRSVPLTSDTVSARDTAARSVTWMASSVMAAGDMRASAMRISWSAVRIT